jgi:ribonuclease HI
MIHI